MGTAVVVGLVVLGVVLLAALLSVRIVRQYERGVVFRLGRLIAVRDPGLRLIVPVVDVLRHVSLRIVTMPIQSQGIITRDNVSVDVSAVAYYGVVDPARSVVVIENVSAAINQIAQTTLRKVVGQHVLDDILADTDRINEDIRRILDRTTGVWGVDVTLVELKDIQLPAGMQRAMAKQAEAEREKRAKIINAEGEMLAADALGQASDVMTEHPLALQLRTLQTLAEIAVDKNSTVVLPAPLMSTISELGTFLQHETAAAQVSPNGARKARATQAEREEPGDQPATSSVPGPPGTA
ncbi:slipin family protein [Kineococcus sp. SYSU DK003]|uniref:slipin family protein n=1 Tax=Kineococcus sp. SYSU DK003 TaxID=3383124 RepID=UPI003D7D4968